MPPILIYDFSPLRSTPGSELLPLFRRISLDVPTHWPNFFSPLFLAQSDPQHPPSPFQHVFVDARCPPPHYNKTLILFCQRIRSSPHISTPSFSIAFSFQNSLLSLRVDNMAFMTFFPPKKASCPLFVLPLPYPFYSPFPSHHTTCKRYPLPFPTLHLNFSRETPLKQSLPTSLCPLILSLCIPTFITILNSISPPFAPLTQQVCWPSSFPPFVSFFVLPPRPFFFSSP